MQIKTFVAGPIDANNYLVWDDSSKEAVLIDSSEYLSQLVDFVNQNGLKVKYILLTHGHFDHILGVNSMKNALNAKVFIHKNDLELVNNLPLQLQFFGLGSYNAEIPQVDETLDNIDELFIGDKIIEILATPGHTKGGVCYKIENTIFSGDTLFKSSVGRWDLQGGNFRDIMHSVKDILLKFPDEITVYSGHGEPTTIGYEKKFNEILKY